GLAGGVSCHLTIGLQAFLLMDLLMVGISQAALRMPELREAMPPGFLASGGVPADLSGKLRQLLSEVSLHIDSGQATEALGEIFAASRQSVADGVISSVPAPPIAALDALVRRRPGWLCTV